MTIHEFILIYVDSKFIGELPFAVNETTFAKNKIITDYGAIENKIYFLKSGIVQVSIAHNDEEKILLRFINLQKKSFKIKFKGLLI